MIPLRTKLEILAGVVMMLTGIALLAAWRSESRAHAALELQYVNSQKVLAEASARQRDRGEQLQKSLHSLSSLKQTVRTPKQVVQELPDLIPLPEPIALQSTRSSALEDASAPVRSNSPPDAPQAKIPASDLKPLYDYAVDCQICRKELAVTQADLEDEKAKTAMLSRERDNALQLARGGSPIQRFGRAAKWFLIGAAAGAAAAKLAH